MIHLLDRYLSTAVFAPLAGRFTHRAGDAPISILMYHSVSNARETEAHPYFWVNTTPERFEEQMRFLKENGYDVISLAGAAGRLLDGHPEKNAPAPAVVITFDDGFRDFYLNAFPVLQEHGFPSTVFLPTAYIGDQGRRMEGKEHLSWQEVAELHRLGVSFGSHTVNHPQLKDLKWDDIEFEIRRSREMMESGIGAPVESFSYPYAFPEEDQELTMRLARTLASCGYRYGVSTRIGRASGDDPIYFLKRLPVNSRDDLAFFKAKLDGGYDWLHRVQLTSKRIRAKF